MRYYKTRVIADMLGLGTQTVLRTVKRLGIEPKQQGKSFVFTREEASIISHALRRRVANQHRVGYFDAEDAIDASDAIFYEADMESDTEDTVDVSETASKDAIVASDAVVVSISVTQEAYTALVAKASLADARKEMLDEKNKTIELLRDTAEAKDDEILALRKQVDSLREQLLELRSKRLTLLERLRGYLLLPPGDSR